MDVKYICLAEVGAHSWACEDAGVVALVGKLFILQSSALVSWTEVCGASLSPLLLDLRNTGETLEKGQGEKHGVLLGTSRKMGVFPKGCFRLRFALLFFSTSHAWNGFQERGSRCYLCHVHTLLSL